MTSLCQFLGTFNRATFYDVECIHSLETVHGPMVSPFFVNSLLALMILELHGQSSQCKENRATHLFGILLNERVDGQRKQRSRGRKARRTFRKQLCSRLE